MVAKSCIDSSVYSDTMTTSYIYPEIIIYYIAINNMKIGLA